MYTCKLDIQKANFNRVIQMLGPEVFSSNNSRIQWQTHAVEPSCVCSVILITILQNVIAILNLLSWEKKTLIDFFLFHRTFD